MFTGLIQGKGRIENAENRGNETRFKVSAPKIKDYEKGESIAINGVCLTVETYSDSWFTCYASKESMSVTNLGNLKRVPWSTTSVRWLWVTVWADILFPVMWIASAQ